MTNVFVCQAADGMQVSGSVVGSGSPVILLAGGIDFDARSWAGVVRRLSQHHTIFRFVRRRYRPELGDPFQWSMREDAEDVAAVAALSSEPVALLAHSSGGVGDLGVTFGREVSSTERPASERSAPPSSGQSSSTKP